VTRPRGAGPRCPKPGRTCPHPARDEGVDSGGLRVGVAVVLTEALRDMWRRRVKRGVRGVLAGRTKDGRWIVRLTKARRVVGRGNQLARYQTLVIRSCWRLANGRRRAGRLCFEVLMVEREDRHAGALKAGSVLLFDMCAQNILWARTLCRGSLADGDPMSGPLVGMPLARGFPSAIEDDPLNPTPCSTNAARTTPRDLLAAVE